MDLFRMRCYLASLQGGELPNPKSLLAAASRPSKLALGRLGIFSVSSFHALVSPNALFVGAYTKPSLVLYFDVELCWDNTWLHLQALLSPFLSWLQIDFFHRDRLWNSEDMAMTFFGPHNLQSWVLLTHTYEKKQNNIFFSCKWLIVLKLYHCDFTPIEFRVYSV